MMFLWVKREWKIILLSWRELHLFILYSGVRVVDRGHYCPGRHDIFVGRMWLMHPNVDSSRCVLCIYYFSPVFLRVQFDSQASRPDRLRPEIQKDFSFQVKIHSNNDLNWITCKKFKIFSEFQKNGCMRTAFAGGRFAGSLLIISVISSSANTDVLSIGERLNVFNSNSYDRMFNCLFTKSPKGWEPFEIT